MKRKYRHNYHNKPAKWSCCGLDDATPGCCKTQHVDALAREHIGKITAQRKAALQEANTAIFEFCSTCGEDVRIPSASTNVATAYSTPPNSSPSSPALECSTCQHLKNKLNTPLPKAKPPTQMPPETPKPAPSSQELMSSYGVIDLTGDSSDSESDLPSSSTQTQTQTQTPLNPSSQQLEWCYDCEEPFQPPRFPPEWYCRLTGRCLDCQGKRVVACMARKH